MSTSHAAQGNIVEVASGSGTFKTLLAAAGAAGLAEVLSTGGPFTVFAPSDAAFAALPAGTVESLLKPENRDKLTSILLYHVVPGRLPATEVVAADSLATVFGAALPVKSMNGTVHVGGASIVATDIAASNGVIHVINAVMLPPTIVEVAGGAGIFKTLLAAATAADLAETLASSGPFTVFAPTDEAFAALPAGTVESLLKPENIDQLKAILLYHVVSGRVMAADALQLDSADTVGGPALSLQASDGALWVGGAKVVKADIQALNGVIHVVDAVLLPPAKVAASASGSGCSN